MCSSMYNVYFPCLLLDRMKMAAGSISAEEFNDLALKFVKFSATINDTWIVKNPPRNDSEVYLEKVVLLKDRTCSSVQAPSNKEAEICLEGDAAVEESDPSCLQLSTVETQGGFVRYLYHLVYSHSYSVPVLYFNVCKTDGKRLSLEEVWSRIPTQYQQRVDHHKWATLTQQEHPYLGSPFFMLHPCHTATLMSQVPSRQDKRYYLIKWLSSVGPVVGLDMSPAYGTAFETTGETKHT